MASRITVAMSRGDFEAREGTCMHEEEAISTRDEHTLLRLKAGFIRIS